MGPNLPLHKDPNHDRWQVHYSVTHIASNWEEVLKWCWKTFGHPGTNPETGQKNSWNYQGGWIYFYDEKLVTMYSLKWT